MGKEPGYSRSDLMKREDYNTRFGIARYIPIVLNKFNLFPAYSNYLYMDIRKRYYSKRSKEELKKEIQDTYYSVTGDQLNIDDPKDFNQKIQWLKIYDLTDEKRPLSDKYLAREYIANKVGEGRLPQLYGVYDSIDDIEFDKLPDSFVIKSTQGSGCNVIVKDKSKINLKKIKKDFKWYVKTEYAYKYLEFQYDVKLTKIIVEENLGDGLDEYKIVCIHGEPAFFWIRSKENGVKTRNFYNINREPMDFMFGSAPQKQNIEIISDFDRLIDDVRRLAEGFKLVRVDTYIANGKYYIGELTFTSGAGIDNWRPKEDAAYYGSLI